MTYEDLKQRILRRIDRERDLVAKKIDKASKCEDWQEIQDDISFIIQGYGSIMVIERLASTEAKFDEEFPESAPTQDNAKEEKKEPEKSDESD